MALFLCNTVKPVLSGHLKKDKTKILMTNGSLMKVESIAECSLGAFCNTFDLHLTIIGIENQFLVFFLSGCLRQVLLYICFQIEHTGNGKLSQLKDILPLQTIIKVTISQLTWLVLIPFHSGYLQTGTLANSEYPDEMFHSGCYLGVPEFDSGQAPYFLGELS